MLFPDEMYAWQYGPVIPLVYNAYSRYGGSPIQHVSIPGEDATDNLAILKDICDSQNRDACSTLENVFKEWADKPAWSLVAKSHEQGKAWDVVYNKDGIRGSGYGEVIDGDTIMATYGRG